MAFSSHSRSPLFCARDYAGICRSQLRDKDLSYAEYTEYPLGRKQTWTHQIQPYHLFIYNYKYIWNLNIDICYDLWIRDPRSLYMSNWLSSPEIPRITNHFLINNRSIVRYQLQHPAPRPRLAGCQVGASLAGVKTCQNLGAARWTAKMRGKYKYIYIYTWVYKWLYMVGI